MCRLQCLAYCLRHGPRHHKKYFRGAKIVAGTGIRAARLGQTTISQYWLDAHALAGACILLHLWRCQFRPHGVRVAKSQSRHDGPLCEHGWKHDGHRQGPCLCPHVRHNRGSADAIPRLLHLFRPRSHGDGLHLQLTSHRLACVLCRLRFAHSRTAAHPRHCVHMPRRRACIHQKRSLYPSTHMVDTRTRCHANLPVLPARRSARA